MPLTTRWTTIAESQYPWERDALDYLRDRLPDAEPVRVWSNAEFVSLDGRLNEVDLIVLTAKGLFLIEIKSRPGEVTGDQQRWTWRDGSSVYEIDSPLKLANLKAKRLAELLAHQKVTGTARLPFVEPLVFCSAPGAKIKLPVPLTSKVFGREPGDGGLGEIPGILSALTKANVGPSTSTPVDPVMARLVSRAMEQAGLRTSAKAERVGDYKLKTLLAEGPTWQDYEAEHVALHARRRVRLYPIPLKASADRRKTIMSAARREFEILEGIHHQGIARADEFRETERGPALVFPFDPQALRLDAFIAGNAARLDEALRLHLLRAIAEIVGYAHKRRLFHRALSPQSILVHDAAAAEPRVSITNWQAGARAGGTTLGSSVSGTEHVDALIDDSAQVYVAPEARLGTGQYDAALDVFSLGAIAYHLFAGVPPADSIITLHDKLRAQGGLIVADVVNGATPALVDLVKGATTPQVTMRLQSVDEFLEYLSLVEDELTRPEPVAEVNPIDAQPGDRIKGNLEVVRRLGKGSTAVALLVKKGEQEFVLKVAQGPEYNARLHAEGQVLRELTHQHIVRFHEEFETAGLTALLIDKAGETNLARRLHEDGPLNLDWLERFGEDLLTAVDWLEGKGISHRDIKPDNIGITAIGRGDRQHLVLFDFSLAREAAENVRSGTPLYLDPFLKLRKRWDLHAERFSAALTLYEMATARLPKWGDGVSDPSMVPGEVTLESDLFDPVLRDGLTAFFRKALARDVSQRFDNAREMLNSWRRVFIQTAKPAAQVIAEPNPAGDKLMAQVFRAALATATPDTPLIQLGLSTRALNALERLGCTTVRQLVTQSVATVWRLPGVGHKTRREIATVASSLKERFPAQPFVGGAATAGPAEPTSSTEAEDQTLPSIDTLGVRLFPKKVSGGQSEERLLNTWLGLDQTGPQVQELWPNQTDIARGAGITRARVSQLVVKARERWRRDALFTALRTDLVEFVRRQGGVVSSGELAAAALALRGSVKDEPQRSRVAHAVVRAAVDVEMAQEEPRLFLRRSDRTMLVATNADLADWALSLGSVADKLAVREPLGSPETNVAVLREVDPPGTTELLSDSRMLRLAAAASSRAAVSSRDELYPRGMAAARALRLSLNLFASRKELSVEQIRERVGSRYPEAELLPDRPALDSMLDEAGFDLEWAADAADGQGAYRSRAAFRISVPTFSSTVTRLSTRHGQPLVAADADVMAARAFEDKLAWGTRNSQFLVLTTSPRDLRPTHDELLRFTPEVVSVDALLIAAMKEAAAAAPVNWDIVVRADGAGRQSPEWRNLQVLVGRAMPKVKAALLAPTNVRLLMNLGLLARYGQLSVLADAQGEVGRPGAPRSLWVLVPTLSVGGQPTVDGVPLPIVAAQATAVPEAWVRNIHRAA
ncbi:MAG: BREX system serine/threonine kinase PglW [Planctomycetota bacterium]